MKFCVLYPNTKNVNLIKDMGMIPFKLYQLFGYDSKIACQRKDEYTYLKNEVEGLEIDYIGEEGGNYIFQGCRYLLKCAKDIDILNIYHITSYSMAYAYVYKLLNSKGKIYLKLDCSEKLIDRMENMNSIEKSMVNGFLNRTDIISAEQIALIPSLKKLFGENGSKLYHVSNGIEEKYLVGWDRPKKKQFLHVARLGAEEKNSEDVVRAFEMFCKCDSQWNLVLVGSMTEEFKVFLNKVIENNPELGNRIVYKGEIKERDKLYEIYKESKAFILNSHFESFAFVLIEAAFFTDAIISTDVGVAKELNDCTHVEISSSSNWENVLESMKVVAGACEKGTLREKKYELIEERYNYNKIIKKLKGIIDKNLNSCK